MLSHIDKRSGQRPLREKENMRTSEPGEKDACEYDFQRKKQ